MQIFLSHIFEILTKHNVPFQNSTPDHVLPQEHPISAPETFAQQSQPQQILFLDTQGENTHTFMKVALPRRVSCVVLPLSNLPAFPDPIENTSLIFVEDVKYACSIVCKLFLKKIPHICAVTGSAGKSSAAFYGYKAARSHGYSAAYLGTEGLLINGSNFPLQQSNFTPRTTPTPTELVRIFNVLKKKNILFLFMEASAHGIAQHRSSWFSCSSTAFTCLEDAHIRDFKSVENIKKTKFSLLQQQNAPFAVHEPLKPAIESMKLSHLQHLTFGVTPQADVCLQGFCPKTKQVTFLLQGQTITAQTELLSTFSILNALCGISLFALALKDLSLLKKSLENFHEMPTMLGRMEKISPPDHPFTVLVDFAHYPSAVVTALTEAKRFLAPQGKIHAIIGGGSPPSQDDDFYRATARAIAQNAHHHYITMDNPRHIDQEHIAQVFLENCPSGTVHIPNRREALLTALKNAKAGDCVIALGKGNEDTISVKGETIYHNDRLILKELLQKEDD